MLDNGIKVIKRADVLANSGESLRAAAKMMVGQADRTNNLFVDVLLDVVERLEKLEDKDAMMATERQAA